MRFRPDPSLDSARYSSLFEAFTANTNSKDVIARIVLEVARGIEARTLLDLGAGDGRLTSKLAPEFTSVTAVEKKPEFCAALQAIPGVSVHQGLMEDFQPPNPHDLVLLSYSLSGVSEEKIGEFMRGLPQFASSNGKVILVTYQKECEWDYFADEIHALLELPRSSGLAGYKRIARESGLALESVAAAPSFMWSDSIANLALLTSFFFASKEKEYHRHLPEVIEILGRYAVAMEDGRIGLRAVEQIFELREK